MIDRRPRPCLLFTMGLWVVLGLVIGWSGSAAGEVVRSREALIRALDTAEPGTTIRLAPGVYRGGMHLRGLHGQAGRPITLTAADPDDPPVLRGGANLIQLSGCSYVTLEHLVLEGATGNGLNIDDGGDIDSPTHHITLGHLEVRDIGPGGNHDGIKLSGVVDFSVTDCTLTDWGSGGAGIDMVGCHRGLIRGCLLRRTGEGTTGIQCKGGTASIRIFANRFERAGQRAVNIGGSTGRQFFRPALAEAGNAEARDIEVAGNVFIGPGVPVAFVGVDGAHVHHNTMIRPDPWAMRILQETVGEDFVPCRDGVFEYNLIVFRRGDLRTFTNVGPNTRPETFAFRGNWWFAEDAPDRSRPQLPSDETDGVYGRDPKLTNDGSVAENSPAGNFGAHAWRDGDKDAQ